MNKYAQQTVMSIDEEQLHFGRDVHQEPIHIIYAWFEQTCMTAGIIL